ncbi:NAD-specific glutamate dehydrogenase [compost metagenome]
MFWTGRVCSDVRQVHVGLLRRRELDFGFFCGFFQALHCQRVVTQVNALIFLKLVNEIVDHTAVKVFTTQVGITVGSQNFKRFFAVNFVDFDNRDIESTATEVVYRDSTVADFFIQTVCQRSGSRFVDDTFHFQTGDTARIFGCLTLSIVKVCRYGDNRFSYWFAQVIFSRFLHFFQHFCRDLRRCHFLTFYINPRITVISTDDFVRHDGFITLHFFVLEAAANQAFDRKQGVLRVCHGLTFSRLTNQSFTVLGISNDRRRGAIALGVLQHTCSSAIHNRYTRVGSPQVDTNNFTHLNVSTKNSVIHVVVNL